MFLGTTLRVAGKPGQTNLIQLASNSGNQVAQFAVVSQNNVVSIAGQQRIVSTVATAQTTTQVTVVTTAKPVVAKNNIKPIATTKLVSSKLAQQFVNAKFIQNVGTNKIIPQQKLVINQPNQIKINTTTKPVTVTKSLITTNPNTNAVRMVNAASLNLAHIGGKPVLLASKGNTIQNIQGQNVIIQTQPSISTSAGNLVLPNNARVIQTSNIVTQPQISQSQPVVLGTQLKVQNVNQNLVQTNANQVVVSSLKTQGNVTQQNTQNTVVLGGHTIKMQGQQNQRVVLASQGQGGQLVAQQILLPPGFQGGAINIKTLQGLKVIPLAQTQQTKGKFSGWYRVQKQEKWNKKITILRK